MQTPKGHEVDELKGPSCTKKNTCSSRKIMTSDTVQQEAAESVEGGKGRNEGWRESGAGGEGNCEI